MEIKVRGIEPGIVSTIDALAEKQGVSRNEYLRKRITAIGIMGDVEEIELKYRQFTDRIIKEVSALADAVNENTRLMADTMNRSADIEDRLSELSEKFCNFFSSPFLQAFLAALTRSARSRSTFLRGKVSLP